MRAILRTFIILAFIGCDERSDSKKTKTDFQQNQIFKIFSCDSLIAKDVEIYKYGVHINLPKDTTGISREALIYLKQIEKIHHKKGQAIHMWFFTDSTAIPNRFFGNWTTEKIESKCFAHAAKYVEGYYAFNYDLLETYEGK